MTVSTTMDTPVLGPGARPSDPYARWLRRVVGAVLDGAILAGASWLSTGTGVDVPSLTPGVPLLTSGAVAPTWPGAATGSAAPWVLATLVAMLLLQAWTGATPGKRVAGVAVVRADTGRPAGFLVATLRVVAHLLDAIFLVGYLRPLWHRERRTFADSLLGTVAVATREPPPHPWFARFRRPASAVGSTVVSVAAGVVCALGVGFSTIYGSSGGSDPALDLRCTLEPPPGTGGATAVLTVQQHDVRRTERRLWVSRDVLRERGDVEAVLRWDGAAPAGEVVLEATISGPDGTAPYTVRSDGTDAGTVAAPGTTTVRIPGRTAAQYGSTASVGARLLVDGVDRGSCVGDTR